MKKRIHPLVTLLLLVACTNQQPQSTTPNDRFIAAMVDASRTLTTDDVYNGLVSLEYAQSPWVEWKIQGDDTLLLVATLQSRDWSYAQTRVGESFVTDSSPENTIWVTIPGEFNAKLRSEAILTDSLALNNRLRELLGLRPDGTESVLNLLWINKNALLRPSYSTDITTTSGSTHYSTTLPSWYKEWFEENIAYSYESPQEGLNYPFTRLGYTYDWGEGKSKYGLSEFITIPSTPITLQESIGCWSYYRTLFAE